MYHTGSRFGFWDLHLTLIGHSICIKSTNKYTMILWHSITCHIALIYNGRNFTYRHFIHWLLWYISYKLTIHIRAHIGFDRNWLCLTTTNVHQNNLSWGGNNYPVPHGARFKLTNDLTMPGNSIGDTIPLLHIGSISQAFYIFIIQTLQ